MVDEADTVRIDGAWFRRTIAYLVEQAPRCSRANALVADALVTDVADAACASFVTLLFDGPHLTPSPSGLPVVRTL
jgi:hypothetical protein